MITMDRLMQAHRRLVSQLMVLDSALDMGPEAWFVIRETCFSLSTQLRQHIACEQRLVSRQLNRLHRIGVEEWRRAAVDHHDVAQRLGAVNEILAGDPCFSLSGLRPTLTAMVQALRGQMAEQEAELFPLLSFASMVQEVFGREALVAPPSRAAGTVAGDRPRWRSICRPPGPRAAAYTPRNLLDSARRWW